ncbi:hypothetical protein C6W92_06010 [Roseovarius sp. A46]|uniref:hypothetical protein n=1 Tax=Roseovarius sp. A46 TaxID=2109331 RepID=UPI0010111CDB|nr:hypothetical protein [Roseovarius sp. A46]RXV64852.1 hypothetical protein C6W92_06010 [Roseovarius sp. A46]
MAGKTLSDISVDAISLAGMVEGMDVLYTAAQGGRDCPEARRARNAMMPLIEVAIQKAWELNAAIEEAERAGRA